MGIDKRRIQHKEGITFGEQWLFGKSVTIPPKLGNYLPRPMTHDPWPTWLTQTQAYPCTDLGHKHIRPHKHIGPHRYIGQDQFTEFYSLLYIISFDGYLSVCPFLNKRFEEKSSVSPKFSTDICLLSWTIVSQRNPCWVGNSSGHLRP